jgi:hypothetical protein
MAVIANIDAMAKASGRFAWTIRRGHPERLLEPIG